MLLKPLVWHRRSQRLWECRLFTEISLGIMMMAPDKWRFRRQYYPSLALAQQAAFDLVLAELVPLIADPVIGPVTGPVAGPPARRLTARPPETRQQQRAA